MALDQHNLKVKIVKMSDEERFKQTTPAEGELFFRMNKRYIAVGDGASKGGVPLASKEFVEYSIKVAEANGSTAGIPID